MSCFHAIESSLTVLCHVMFNAIESNITVLCHVLRY